MKLLLNDFAQSVSVSDLSLSHICISSASHLCGQSEIEILWNFFSHCYNLFLKLSMMRLSKRPLAHFQSGDHLTIDSRSSPTTIYVADRTSPGDHTPPVKGIRQRNTSQNSPEEFLTPIGKFIPKVSGSPTSIVTTPGYDFKSRSCDGTPDSGYVDDSTFTPSSVRFVFFGF